METDEKESNKLLLEHEYDGIRELDNDPPAWIIWLFWITIFFAAIYLVHYHAFKQGDLQDKEYENEVVASKVKRDTTSFNENKIVVLKDSVSLNAAKKLFKEKTCGTCHGNNAEGNAVGPNLTDDYWLEGGKPEQIFKTIKYGYAAKGMTAYKDQLSNKQIQQLVSLILIRFKGSKPLNAKAPQGNKE